MSKKLQKNQSVVIELQDPGAGKPKQARLKKRLLVAAPLTAHTPGTPEKDPVEVTKGNIKQLAGFRPTLVLDVANRLTGDEATKLQVEIKFDSIDDFTPHGISRKVAPLDKLVRIKEALLVLKSKLKDPLVVDRLKALVSQSPEELKKLLPPLPDTTQN